MSTHLAYDFPLLSMFWTMLWFFLWVMWFVLLFRIIGDVFRDDSLSGWGKTGWLLFVVLLPFVGVFVYVIARGKGMGARDAAHVRARQKAFDDYVRETAGAPAAGSSVDELARLAEIRDRGALSDEEFRRAKELVLSGGRAPAGGTPAAGAGSGAAGV